MGRKKQNKTELFMSIMGDKKLCLTGSCEHRKYM